MHYCTTCFRTGTCLKFYRPQQYMLPAVLQYCSRVQKKYSRTNFYVHAHFLTFNTWILDARTFTHTTIICLLTTGSSTDELVRAQPLCSKFSTAVLRTFTRAAIICLLTPRSLTDELLRAQPVCTKFSTGVLQHLKLDFVDSWVSYP